MIILEHIGKGQYKPDKDLTELEDSQLQDILKKSKKFLEKQPSKIFYIPNKLINFVE